MCARAGCTNGAAPLNLPGAPFDTAELVLLCPHDVADVVRSCREKWRGGKETKAASLALKASAQFGNPVAAVLCRLCDGYHLSSASPPRAAARKQTIEVLRTVLSDEQRRALRDVWHPRKAPTCDQRQQPLTGRAAQRDERRRNPVGCASCQKRPARQQGGPLCEVCRTEVEQMCKKRTRYGSRRAARTAAPVGQTPYECALCDAFHYGPPVDREAAERSARVLRDVLPEHGLRLLLQQWDPAG